MVYIFILELGKWNIVGNWLECNGMLIIVKGKIIVIWDWIDWFFMVIKLIFFI